MRKNLLALVLVMLLVISVTSVSAQGDAMPMPCPEGEVTLRVAAGAVGAEAQVFQEQADRYMALCPNVTVEAISVPDSSTDRLALYQQIWEVQGSDIDVFQTDVIWAGIIAPHVVDLNMYLPEGFLDNFFPDMVAGQNIGGKQVAIPWFTDAAGLYYRTDLLEKYGLSVPTTWDELAAAAQIIQDGERAEGNQDFWGFVWQGNSYEGLTCDAHEWLVSETGQTFISPDGEVNVNNDAFINALERAAGWVGTISPNAVTTYQEEESRAVFQAGNAAFMRNWPYAWGLGNSEGSVIAGLFDYAPLPTGAVRAAACLGGWQLAVSAYSRNPEAAVALAAFLTSPEEQFFRATSTFPVNPTVPALYEDPALAEQNPLYARMGPILATAYARPSGITAERYNEASTLFFTGVHRVLTGSSDALSAVEDLELDLQELLMDMGVSR